jgi:hypothetical protein
MELNYVLEVLKNNGIDDCYFEEMGGKEIERGGDEWMDVLSEIIGRDSYEVSMEGDFNDDEIEKINMFIEIVEEEGIEFV